LQVFQMYVASVLGVFRHMLQVFYLDFAKVDQLLHLFSRCFASVSDVCCKCFNCFWIYVPSV
jgi:hypothetical protein